MYPCQSIHVHVYYSNTGSTRTIHVLVRVPVYTIVTLVVHVQYMYSYPYTYMYTPSIYPDLPIIKELNNLKQTIFGMFPMYWFNNVGFESNI